MIYYNPRQNKIIESKNVYIVFKKFGGVRTKKLYYIESKRRFYLISDLILLK